MGPNRGTLPTPPPSPERLELVTESVAHISLFTPPDSPDSDHAPQQQLPSNFQVSPITPARRHYSDRYIPSHTGTPETFRLSTNPEKLSPSERFLRHNSATPDPFSPHNSSPLPRRLNIVGPRPPPANGRIRFATRHETRVVSPDAVWNVGGLVPPSLGPVSAVHDGHGHMMTSGTTAPMYASNFFKRETDQNAKVRFEGRVAAGKLFAHLMISSVLRDHTD